MKTPYVIVGSSVAGQALAAGLLKKTSPESICFLTEPTVENRRLIAGCSLRYSTIQRLTDCLDCTPNELIQELSDGKGIFTKVSLGLCKRNADGSFLFEKPVQILDSGSEKIAGLSTRHGQILLACRKILAKKGLVLTEKKMTQLSEIQEYGELNTNYINATANRNLFPIRGSAPKPTRFVVAVQAPFVISKIGLRAPLTKSTGYAPVFKDNNSVNVGFFTPFADPLSPQASWYGINTRIVKSRTKIDQDAEIAATLQGMIELAQAFGLEILDAHQTLGSAVIPVSDYSYEPHDPQYFDAYQAFASGAPAIYVDGMLSMATGAKAYLDHFDEKDVFRFVRSALRGLRMRNRLIQFLMLGCPYFIVVFLVRAMPWCLRALMGLDWIDD